VSRRWVLRGKMGGFLYAFAGDYQAALPLCDPAIRLSPRGPQLIIYKLVKGWAALLSECYQEAVDFGAEAAEANPEFPDNYAGAWSRPRPTR